MEFIALGEVLCGAGAGGLGQPGTATRVHWAVQQRHLARLMPSSCHIH